MSKRILSPLVGLLTLAGLCAGSTFVNRSVPDADGPTPSLAFVPPPSGSPLAHLLSSLDPGSHVLRAIAIDLDVDGDFDLIATTADEVVVVWVNEGSGRLVRQERSAKSGMSSLPGLESSTPGGRVPATAPRSRGVGGDVIALLCRDGCGPSVLLISPSYRTTARPWGSGSGRAPPACVARA